MSQTNPKHSRRTGQYEAYLARKRAEAQERQAERAKRSPEEQLARLDERGEAAERERARLLDKIAHPSKKTKGGSNA